ncbi:MAG: hypothetical protein A6F71_00960 [Cycloclasticus sp. symbiont of Poecilosclerida sp. M]|nr:MAG: hypothetical protein A6F71_00960 [Cycloclasticus sp. symbiont of Poecilosclerida sp. M]
MWSDLFAAIALVLVIEGLLPFISPSSMRENYKRITEMNDQTIRMAGLVSMIGGVLLLTWVR